MSLQRNRNEYVALSDFTEGACVTGARAIAEVPHRATHMNAPSPLAGEGLWRANQVFCRVRGRGTAEMQRLGRPLTQQHSGLMPTCPLPQGERAQQYVPAAHSHLR